MTTKQAQQAARVLRDHAPTKNHEIRRACIAAANELEASARRADREREFIERSQPRSMES